MGSPSGSASYDDAAMQQIAGDTDAVSDALGGMREHATEKTLTPKAFGPVGERSNVGGVFEETWTNLANSLGTGARRFHELAQDVESSFTEQESRDQQSAQDIQHSGGN